MYLSVGWSFDRISTGWNMSQRICTNVLNSVVLYFRQSYSSHVSVANVHCRCSLAAQYLSATVFFYMYIVWCKKVFLNKKKIILLYGWNCTRNSKSYVLQILSLYVYISVGMLVTICLNIKFQYQVVSTSTHIHAHVDKTIFLMRLGIVTLTFDLDCRSIQPYCL